MSFPSPLKGVEPSYPVLVVGGGIVGAGIFRDLSLHGVSCLLVDKKDFSSQTSQSSSKILHGGIRYLETMDFGLVREACGEKRHWLSRAPHLCQERAFHLPVFEDSLRPLWKIKMGLVLYDMLSLGSSQRHSLVSADEAMGRISGLRQDGLRGAGIYYDAVVDDIKLTLEVIYDALEEPGSEAINHVALQELEKEKRGGYRALLRDELTGEEKIVRATSVIFATGPFTDQLLQRLKIVPWEPRLLPSKGIHLWMEREHFPLEHPVLLTPRDKRVIFAIPKEDKVLVGTTETAPEQEFFDIQANESEITYLLRNVAHFFPQYSLGREAIVDTFAGIRPLVKGHSDDRHKTTREHNVFRPERDMYVVVGGKYTTFRLMGQEITRSICLRENVPYNSGRSENPLRRQSVVVGKAPSAKDIRTILKTERVRTLEDLIKRRLGVPRRSFWRSSVPFDDFFAPLMPELERHLHCSSFNWERF